MADLVERREVEATTVASVRRRVAVADIPSAWREPLDAVWDFLGRHPGLRDDGHNVFLYRPTANEGMVDAEFGVEVTRDFEPEGEVECRSTPAGNVLETVHRGPVERIGEAHAAIQRWALENDVALTGVDWEIYGDWTDDPADMTTTIRYQVADE